MADSKTQAVIEKINDLFGDTSVSIPTAIERMETIRDAVEENLLTLRVQAEDADDLDMDF